MNWSSSNQSVATVNDSGKVTAISEGETVLIAVSHNGKIATCTIKVQKPNIEAISVSLDKTSLTLELGMSEIITATILPINTTNKDIVWSSSNPSVATVNNSGKITAIMAGSTILTATVGTTSANCIVTVIDVSTNFTYLLSGNGYILTGYSGSDTKVNVPSTYKGKPVTVIYSYAFQGQSQITELIIPNSVQAIGFSALAGCDGLEKLTLPFIGERRIATSNTHFGFIFGGVEQSTNNSVVPKALQSVILTDATHIARYAFSDCKSLTSVTIDCDAISMEDNVFAGCSSLKECIWSENSQLTTINTALFTNCSSLTNITIPSTVTTIKSYAFSGCGALAKITIPDSVMQIESDAFQNCKNLTIYCVATRKPSGWSNTWCGLNAYGVKNVVWGYKENE